MSGQVHGWWLTCDGMSGEVHTQLLSCGDMSEVGSYVLCSQLRDVVCREVRSWWITCVGLRAGWSVEKDYERGGAYRQDHERAGSCEHHKSLVHG